jgi:hypothetical protein
MSLTPPINLSFLACIVAKSKTQRGMQFDFKPITGS